MAHSKQQLNTFHLFAGCGGGILADILLGHNPIGACEIEPYPRNVLLARQADGHLPNFPIWDDVATLDGNPWRGTVDVLCGGFPCQDISSARTNNHVNGKQLGLDGAKSGLWRHMARVIMEMRPRFAFIENSPNLRTKGLVTVLKDLDEMGYHTRRIVIGSRHVGADHHRDRMWILAYANLPQREGGCIPSGVPKAHTYTCSPDWRESESRLERVKDGMAYRLDRLKAIGNGQDCRVAASAFNILSEGLI
jgi:DNA (cytosine-5)-methyltransferase 1